MAMIDYDFSKRVDAAEEEVLLWYRRLGWMLLAGFILPVFTPGFMGSRLVFPNLSLLGEGGFWFKLSLLYPLLAGGMVLWALGRLEGMTRAATLLSTGLAPLVLTLVAGRDLYAFMLRSLLRSTLAFQLMLLALVGLYVGGRGLSRYGAIGAGRRLAGASGGLFLLLFLTPVMAPRSPFLALFEDLGGGMLLLRLGLIGVALSFLAAAGLGLWHLGERDDAERAGWIIRLCLVRGALALPVLIFLQMLFTSAPGVGKNILFTILLKVVLLAGGTLGLLALSAWDLFRALGGDEV